MEPRVEISLLEPDGDEAANFLVRYHKELDSRFPGGFVPDGSVSAAPDEITPPNGALLVARLGGTNVGCGAVRRLDRTTAEIKQMWIDPAVRGRGVGRQLLAALEETARTMGCRVARLDRSRHLTEAVALYRSAGYGEIPAYNENPYAALWFEKTL